MTLEDRLRDTLASDNPAATPINAGDVIGTAQQRRRHRRVTSASLLVVAVLAVSSAAYAAGPWRGGSDNTGITAAAGGDATDETTAVAAYRAKLQGWVSCLNENGATVGPVGNDIDAFFTGLGQLKGDAAYEAAAEVCASKLPVVTDEVERASGNVPATARQVQKYARCMHEHGATRFPTPGADGLTAQQSNDWLGQPLSAEELKADEDCGPIWKQ